MNIVLVIPSLQPGGAERVLSIMANYWAALDRRVTILTFASPDCPPFFSLHSSIQCRSLALAKQSVGIFSGLGNNLWRLRVLRKVIKSIRPDIVISFLTETNVLTLLSTRLLDLPVIVAEHTDPYRCPVPRPWAMLRGMTYRWANRVVVLTKEAKAFFKPELQQNVSVVPNPVLVPAPGTTAEQRSEREHLVLAVGRLSDEKGYDLLLRAFSSVASELDDWSLSVIGDGPDRVGLERQAEDLGIHRRVTFHGVVPEPGSFYRRAGLFVLSSRYEGFPMGLCEAMACGCAVIATEYNKSVFDLIEHGKNGLIVPREDAAALADAMRLLLSNIRLRRKLGCAATGITTKYGEAPVMAVWDGLIAQCRA